jgi:pyrroline-5-carboxylate reductase
VAKIITGRRNIMLANKRIAFIGAGHITEIIVHNLSQGQVIPPHRPSVPMGGQLIVSDPDPARLQHLKEHYGVTTAPNNVAAAQQGELILVNVRPEVVKAILPDLQAAQLRPEQLVISLAAGIPLSQYSCLGEQQALVRALPNPPSQIGQGIAALVFSAPVTAEQRQLALALFAALGQVVEVEEAYLNLITSLSSPVATYLFFQALIDAGVYGGLPRPIATQVAAQTIVGSMSVWQARQVSPAELISEASTPGGISVESLFSLEQHAFKASVMEAIANGAARAAVLGNENI